MLGLLYKSYTKGVGRNLRTDFRKYTQEVLLAQFSLYVHKSGLKPDSFHFISKIPNCYSYNQIHNTQLCISDVI